MTDQEIRNAALAFLAGMIEKHNTKTQHMKAHGAVDGPRMLSQITLMAAELGTYAYQRWSSAVPSTL